MAATATAPPSDPQMLVTQAIKKVTAIATLPEVTAQIVATVQDPRSSAKELHKIVSHDPALMTRILKVVNSAFYGLPGQIGSVERAIALLGLNAVKNIAVAASLGQLFRGVKLCEGYSARDLWTHCIAVAVTARELARQMKLPIADEAFLAGLIHDVGLLVELHVWPDHLCIVCERVKRGGGDFCQIERELMGVDHQQMGMGLTQQWKFTRSCQLVAGYHHQPGALEDHHMLVKLVFAADTICCHHHCGFDLTAINQKIEEAAAPEIGLSQEIIDQTAANLDTLMASALSGWQ